MLGVGTRQRQRTLIAAEETDPVVDVGVREDRVRAERETAAEGEILPVVALGEGLQHGDRRTRDDAKSNTVDRTHQLRRVVGTHHSGAHRTILPDPRGCGTI